MRRKVLIALAAILCAAGTVYAVPMGTGTLLVEVQGSSGDNVSCSRTTSYANQTYDVFGVNVNLSTDLVEMVCTGGTIAGVPQVGHCESYPSPSIWSVDVLVATVCLNPPSCTNISFVSDSVFNVTGSLPTSIGSDVAYAADGEITFSGSSGSTSIPGCPIVGAVGVFTGIAGINAFQTEATPVGTNQTVSFPETTFFNPLNGQEIPIDVDITFAEVTGAGTTTVTATSNAAGSIPSNFAAGVNGFQAAFLSITSTATLVPPIDVCSSYQDIDDDGIVDGTSPAIPEDALSFLHGEGNPVDFVDRTFSRDPVNNIICARVDTLSPFAVLVRTNGICANVGDPCDDGDACTIDDECDAGLECVGGSAVVCDDGNLCTADTCVSPGGCVHPPAPVLTCNTSNDKALILVRDHADDNKDQVLFKWLEGTSAIGEFGDPTAATGTEYTVCVSDANNMLASATTAPAASLCGANPCWKFLGPLATPTGVKYVDPARASDGVKLVNGKAGSSGTGKALFKALGANVPPLDIAGITYPVTVQVRTNDAACWEQVFDVGDQKKNDGTLFKAVHLGP